MLLAKRWQENGLYPFATDAGAGRPGRDILNTPGVFVEVKARGRLTLLETLAKCEQGAEAENELPLVVWRHNGQGETDPGLWTATMRLHHAEQLIRETQSRGILHG